jgi:hypothetical protein
MVATESLYMLVASSHPLSPDILIFFRVLPDISHIDGCRPVKQSLELFISL